MPTGYTAGVSDGEITEFRDFALICARAFGALISMRDEPTGAEIPEKFEPSTKYHDEQIAEARSKLKRLDAMTPDQVREAALAACDVHMESLMKWRADRALRAGRYQFMLAQVERWKPPTDDHVEMKAFMIGQLRESIKFDAEGYEDFEKPEFDVDGWEAAQRDEIAWSIEYHTKAIEDEIKRAEGRTKWVADLRASLPPPAE